MGPSFGKGADGAILCFCFVQRREIMEVNFLVSQIFVLLGFVFLLDVLTSAFGLGKREPGALPCIVCFETARREEVQFG